MNILLILLPVVFYLPLYLGFFQQDEWFGFSQYVLHNNLNLFQLLFYFFKPSVGHFTPFTIALVHTLFSIVGLNYKLFFTVSLLLHATTIFLFFQLSTQLFQNKKTALVCTLLFGILASHYQGTGWVIANLSTHGASIFGLLSLIFLLKSNLKKSLLYLIVSLMFKETTIGLFPLMLFMTFILSSLKKTKKSSIVTVAFFYVLSRALMSFSPVQVEDSTVFSSQPPIKIAYNFLTVPIKAVSQSLIPIAQIKLVSQQLSSLLDEKITGEKGSPAFEVFVVKRGIEAVTLTFSIFIILFSLFVLSKSKNERYLKVGLIGLAWVLLNSAVFSLAPEKPGVVFTIDSRYLYFVSMGSSLFFTSVFVLFIQRFPKLGLFLLGLFCFVNLYWLTVELDQFGKVGQIRKSILLQIKREHFDLSPQTIFYTESDKSYYGLPATERIFPFQSGLGQTLLAFYYKSERFPPEFFTDRFLWDTLSQGYKQEQEVGFGYFRDFELLSQTIKKLDFDPKKVIGYRFDSTTNVLTDISDEVQGRVTGLKSVKKQISKSAFKITSSHNPLEINKAVDKNRNSKWDSHTPYIVPQDVLISLASEKMIAQIDIDSYTDQNQDRVGYEILVSQDFEHWQTVFYSKKYPPNLEGLTRIYTRPVSAKFVKINQIGDHQFSSWVINELSLYEAIN